MKRKVSVSFLSSKNKEEDLIKLGATDTDYIHVDVMDGKFVKNKNLPFKLLDRLSYTLQKRLDVHLMVKDIKKYGFTSDLKLGKNKYDIALLTKNKKIIIPVDQFKNKDIMKLLNTIEDKTNMKPYGFAKHLKERKKLWKQM